MLLGKRPRAPMMRRTTSMTGITTTEPPSDDQNLQMMMMITGDDFDQGGPTTAEEHHHNNNKDKEMMMTTMMMMDGNYNSYEDPRFLATMVSPRNYYRRNPSGDFADRDDEPAHFLRTCGLCSRRLAPGKDIYMYRGDTAFCSLECREKQMKQDERKEKCTASPSSTSSSTTKSETMVAA